VPIIVAVITAIVSPIVVPMIQDLLKYESKESPFPPTPGSQSNITVGTDKESYTKGEVIRISGNVDKPESGKSLRIDVYNPKGDVLSFVNGIDVYPNGKGFYTYEMHTDVMTQFPEVIPGEYEILVTYRNQSAKDKFIIE
jgi:hypothetical protein